MRFVSCHCLYILSSLCLSIFCFCFPLFLPWFPNWQGPWSHKEYIFSHSNVSLSVSVPDQVPITQVLGSHHCPPYHLSLRFVSLYVLAYGSLLFLLFLVALEKVLDQIPLENKTSHLHVALYMTRTVNCSAWTKPHWIFPDQILFLCLNQFPTWQMKQGRNLTFYLKYPYIFQIILLLWWTGEKQIPTNFFKQNPNNEWKCSLSFDWEFR